MGYEYTLKVPKEFRAAVAEQASTGISHIFERLPADASKHVNLSPVPEGLLLCDNLSHESDGAMALQRAVQWLLLHAPEVTIAEA